MRLIPIKWPNDAKIAVSFCCVRKFKKSSQYRRSEGNSDYASRAYGEYRGKEQRKGLTRWETGGKKLF